MAKKLDNPAKQTIWTLYFRQFGEASGLAPAVFLQDYGGAAVIPHGHADFYELVVVLSGTARNEGRDFPSVLLRPGDVFLLKPGSEHCYRAIRGFRHYNLLFRPEILKVLPEGTFRSLPAWGELFAEGSGCSPVRRLARQDLPELVPILESMRREMLLKPAGWIPAMFAEFIRALVFLLRHAEPAEGGSDGNALQIGRVVRRMERHTAEPVRMEELARFAGMSESGFRHRFRELTGVSPLEYLIRLRIRRSLVYLASGKSVESAAADSGFSDSGYFTRCFRKRMRMTPGEFRLGFSRGEFGIDSF